MGDAIKTLISTQIKAFEQGSFQDFCLAFLSLYDSRFIGIERHGGTADGKTRAGTPDLIKTDNEGLQICVQCSVEKDYWSKPGNIYEWKPIKDIQKCTENISSAKEIVLCASQEIPTTQPNVKSEIIEHAKNITTAAIQPISISNFEESIRNDTYKYSEIIKRFFPELHDWLSASSRQRLVETTLNSYKRFPLPLESIERIVRKHFESEKMDVSALELELAEVAKSRFLRSRPPAALPIRRQSATEFISKHKFDGTIYCVLGVPKIGKTSWVSQICHDMANADFKALWFEAPYEHSAYKEFCQDFKRHVIEKMVGPEMANQYVDKKIGIVELESFLRKSSIDAKYIFVIDNAEKLIPDGISGIKDFLSLLKRSLSGKQWGLILISNIKLNSYIGNIAAEIQYPAWNHDEISQLLNISKIDIRDNIAKYAELLTINSGGHPLVALSLARQASHIVDLLPLKPKAVPLYDEDLTAEIKQILFNDLLKDNDHRDLVLRLSVLFSRFDLPLVEFVASIEPSLRTPVKLMFENLKYTVIEGDNQIGYQIAFVFKQVAADYLTDKYKREIYDKIGTYLMTPKDKTINADAAIDAIYYAIAASKLMNALSWATLLLYSSKEFNKEQTKYLLNRLDIISALNFPKESTEKLSYFMALLIMSIKYGEIDEDKKANEFLQKLLNNPLDPIDIPKELKLSYDQINTMLCVYTVFNLVQLREINSALELINKQNAKPLIDILSKVPQGMDLLHTLISMGTSDHFPKDLIKNLIINASLEDDDLMGELASCFLNLGIVAHREKKDRASLANILKEGISKEERLLELFGNIALAQYELESNNEKDSLKITDEVFFISESVGIRSEKFKQKLLFLKGDAFYQLTDFESAYKEYSKSLTHTKEKDSFEYGWLTYRLGLSTTDNFEALKCFKEASQSFEKSKYLNLKARSDGEAAVALYQLGKLKESVDLLLDIVDGFYLENIQEYGPAATIAVGVFTRLCAELKGESFDEKSSNEKVWPKLEKRVFSRVLDLAKPEAGVSSAYYFYGEIYELLGEEQKALRCFKTSLEGIERIKEDKLSKAMAAKSLFPLFLRMGMGKESLEIIDRLLIISREIESNIPNFGITLIFGMMELLLTKQELKYAKYLSILNYIEQQVKVTPAVAQKDRWLSEIYNRKAKTEGTEDYDSNLLLIAYNYAKESHNYTVMINTAHQLGFRYISKMSSFRELAEIQLSVIFAICQDGGDIERLDVVGTNLMKLWSVITFTRLRESDFPYLENLRDRAKSIKADSPEELHAPLMILFLMNVMGVGQNEEYKKAIQWAKNRLIGKLNKVPPDDYKYIKCLIEDNV